MRTMRYRAQTELAQQMSAKRQTTESRAKKKPQRSRAGGLFDDVPLPTDFIQVQGFATGDR